MAIYTNVLYHSLHGDLMGCSIIKSGTHIAAHADPILVFFAPLFALYPRPELLLILQSIWFGLGIFPVYLLANRVIGNKWAGVVVAAVFAFYPSLHLVNLFEFHSLALICTPLLWALYFLEAGHFRKYFVLLPLIFMIREDISLLMCFVGLSVVLSDRKHAWVGALTIFFSLCYFVFIKLFIQSSAIIGSGNRAYSYTSYFSYMIPPHGGVKDVLISILTNPLYSLRYMVSVDRIEAVLRLLSPLLFLPLFAKKGLVMLVYGVIFLLPASKPGVFSPFRHYQMVVVPILIALVSYRIKHILDTERFGLNRQILLPSLLGALLAAGLLNGLVFGAILPQKTPRQFTYELSEKQQRTFEKVNKMVEMMGPDVSVTASYNLAPFAAVRMNVYSMNRFRPKEPTDYLFLDRVATKKETLAMFDEQIDAGIYKRIAGYGKIVLYKHPDKGEDHSLIKKRKKRVQPAHDTDSPVIPPVIAQPIIPLSAVTPPTDPKNGN